MSKEVMIGLGLLIGYVILTRQRTTATRYQSNTINQQPDLWLKMAGIQVAGELIQKIALASMEPTTEYYQ